MRKSEKTSIKQDISDYDDDLAAFIVSKCHEIMRDYPTVTQMKACYNLMYGIFRLFKIRGKPESLKKMAKEIHDGLLEGIDE